MLTAAHMFMFEFPVKVMLLKYVAITVNDRINETGQFVFIYSVI